MHTWSCRSLPQGHHRRSPSRKRTRGDVLAAAAALAEGSSVEHARAAPRHAARHLQRNRAGGCSTQAGAPPRSAATAHLPAALAAAEAPLPRNGRDEAARAQVPELHGDGIRFEGRRMPCPSPATARARLQLVVRAPGAREERAPQNVQSIPAHVRPEDGPDGVASADVEDLWTATGRRAERGGAKGSAVPPPTPPLACTVLSQPADTITLSSSGSNLSEKMRFEWPGVTPATPPESVAVTARVPSS